MINFFFLNKLSFVLVGAFGIYLAFWVYFANRKAKINQQFTLMILLALLWTSLAYFSGISLENPKLSLLLARLAYGICILFFIPFYFFSIELIEKKEKFPFLKILILTVSLITSFFSFSTDFIVRRMIPTAVGEISIGLVPVFGEGKFIYFGFVFLTTLLILVHLIKKYLKSSEIKKLKIQYLLVGLFIFVFFQIFFNVILAFKEGIPRFYYFGNFSVIFLLGFTAYAIVKRELFDIKIVVTSIFVALIAILLASDALLFTEMRSIQILKGVALAIFLVFGHMLIKSVVGEVKRREELEKLNKAKTEFISMASHQLRTPLTAIKGYSSLMLEGTYENQKAKQKKVLKNIFVSAERLLKIVNDLLNISRIELGKLELAKEPVKIEKLVESVYQETKPYAQEKGIKLIFNKPKKVLPEINVDPLKIRQVIFNLIDNSIKYTEKGEIKIGIEKLKSKIQIIISDTGKGFTEEEKHRLFELFVRGEAGIDTFVEGTGIGLNVARKFVELHGGKIRAESEGKNKGATFYIELPVE